MQFLIARNLLIVHPLVFGVACCGAVPKPERQVGTTRTNGENDNNNVDKMSASSRCWITRSRKERIELAVAMNDLPKTFTFLEFSFAKRILR